MNLYDFTCNTLSGENFDLNYLKGKKVLIVNVASECGLTPQYEQLQSLYETYGGENFEIIAFPSNDFAGQEPGTPEEIASFCKKNYGVTFPILEKIHVIGEAKHPIYEWLCASGLEVKWNFHKFLVNEQGKLVKDIEPRTLPSDPEIIEWITS